MTNPAQRPLTEAERHQVLVEWNATQTAYLRDVCLHQLFEAQVNRTPEAVAVVFEDDQLTYRELNRRANQLAHHLRELGVGPDVLVGLCVERSLELVVGLLGVLKAGGAHVPLDPSYPQERLAFMLTDCQAPVLLTQQQLRERLPAYAGQVVCLDRDWSESAGERGTNVASGVRPEHLAYVIYTSGSTGRPKGVMIPHQAIVNHMHWMQACFPLSTTDRVLQKTPVSFDASVWEFYAPLLAGAQLILARPGGHQDSAYLVQVIAEQQVTIVQMVPTLLHMVLEEPGLSACTALRRAFCGGEALPFALQEQFFARLGMAALQNLYGPTEATIDATWWVCEQGSAQQVVPIGRPIANTQVYVLDAQLHPVPIGMRGELHIGGIGLARGYLHRPDLTAERFVPDPLSQEPGGRLYKTGDLARHLPDGSIEYLGRQDTQVKIRGYRIELGEVEAALGEHPDVRECVVLAREDTPGNQRLVAYLVPRQGATPTAYELRTHLQERLPDYMVPWAFVVVDALPLTPNGKVDHRALPAPDRARVETEASYVAPRTPTEEVLAGIWADVLGLEQVGVHDHFFELGGHSLAATQILARVRRSLAVELSLRDLFEHPTVASLAELVEQGSRGGQCQQVPAIQPIPRDGELPLSFSQERVWFMQQLAPENRSYNAQATLRFTGPLDVAALERSFTEIVRRHDILRTTFPARDGRPEQRIHPPQPMHLSVIDLQAAPEGEREAAAQRVIDKELATSFDLTRFPLIRWLVLRLSPQDHVLLHVEHHLLHDGWSFNVLLYELVELYKAFAAGKPSPLPELAIQFADFAYWQRQWMQGEVAEAQLAYWTQKLTRGPPLLELPYDRPRQAMQRFRGAAPRVQLPVGLCAALRDLSRREGVTLFMTMLAAFLALLCRYTGQEDICIGTAIANRRWRETESLQGMIINTLALRTDLSGAPTFRELLRRVRDVTLEAYSHQDLPFGKVVEALQPERSLSYLPVYQVMFSFHDAAMPQLEFPGLDITLLEGLGNGTAKFDLSVVAVPRPEDPTGWNPKMGTDGTTLIWEYDTDLFDAGTIARMAEHYQTLLEGVVAEPEQRLTSLPLMREAERYQLLEQWNAIHAEQPQHMCLHQLFEAQVKRTPEAVAVVFEDDQLTYRELNRRANQLAHHLRELGVGPDVLVGVCVERSLELVVGLLGVLKAGGAHVPLDPSYPQERLAFMLTDCQAPVLLTQQQLRERLLEYKGQVVCLDTGWEAITQERPTNPVSSVLPDHLAYVIYTSGSTGRPKGVMIPHRAICNHMLWMCERFPLTRADRVLQKTPFSFDASVWEFYAPLLAGAQLTLARPGGHQDSAYLVELIAQQQITILQLVPSLLRVLLEERGLETCTSLRRVFCGGEALPFTLQERFFARMRAELHNLYGPTEATIDATWWPCEPESAQRIVPIGRPISNVSSYVLDAQLQPAPIGVAGELYIGGAGLARGYRNRPELTAERFVPDPFSAEPGARLYRTGDLARYLPDGAIEYLGRRDTQVKVRGFRIELGEIEAVLSQHPGVREAVVLAREDTPGDQRLVAYLVPRQEPAPTTHELHGYLQEHLPEYMVPTTFMLLDALPLMPSGKVDRRALPAPDRTRPETEAACVAPRTPTEKVLADIWADVLGLEQVGVRDSFFDLGGHSLLATQVISRIRDAFQVELALRSLFEAPTIADLAVAITQYRAEQVDSETLALMLTELESLSDEEVHMLLATEQ